VNIIWKEWQTVPETWSFGHGVAFHDLNRPREASLIAWIKGYVWLHDNPETVEIFCIAADSITTVSILERMKEAIAEYVRKKDIRGCETIAPYLEARPNA
jgi:hypothetical protein